MWIKKRGLWLQSKNVNRLRFDTRRLFTALLALALLVMSVRETLDPDIWWHLRTGEAILQRGAIPQFDIFSYTVLDHVWIVQQWLADLLMWGIFRWVGLGGLMVFFALVVMAAFMLVYQRCAGRPYIAAAVILLAYFTAALPIGVRPQMFNMLFLALFLNVVEGVRQRQLSPRYFWLLPLITMVWANMHSGYLTGVALLAAYVVGDGLQRWLGRPAAEILPALAWRRLALITLLALFSALINPRGLQLWLFPLETLGSNVIQSNIVEWFSPDFHSIYFAIFGLMLFVGVGSMVIGDRPVTWTDLILFWGPAAGGLLSARHIPLFAVAAAPIIARHLTAAVAKSGVAALLRPPEHPALPTRRQGLFNWVVLLAMLLLGLGWVLARITNNDQAVMARYPTAAVDYLADSGLAASRLYHTYEWGGYLIWRQIPVFIDGRTELYGDEFFRSYLRTIRVYTGWQKTLDEWGVQTVLLQRDTALATLLETSPAWETIYIDEMAHIFVRGEGQ